MGWKNSLHGRAVQYDSTNMYLFGRIVGNDEVGLGRTFYVDSAIAGGDGSSPDTALATLNAAMDQCVAHRGDKVIVMPGHTETLSAADAVDLDVAGVYVKGI